MTDELDRLIRRAYQQIDHQDLFGAIETLRRALTLDPDDAHAHATLALCLHQQKRLYAAEYEARAALTLAPELILALYVMAMVEISKRRFKQAEQHLQSALALNPQSTRCLLGLAGLYSLWGRQREAWTLLDRAREVDPDDPAVWAALAENYRDARDFEQAERHARAALEVDAEHSDALITMGYLLLRRGEAREAREHALVVLRNNGSHEGAIHLLAAVKAHESPLLGAWWRFNSFLNGGTMSRRVILLIGMYLTYRVCVIAADDLGYQNAILPLNIAWLGLCIYSWVGPAIFARQIAKELAPSGVRPNY